MLSKLSGVTAVFGLSIAATFMAPMDDAKAAVATKAEASDSKAEKKKLEDMIFVPPADDDFHLAALPPLKSGGAAGPVNDPNRVVGMTRNQATALAGARADRAFWSREIGYQVLNAVDAYQTIRFLDKGSARELNPLLGRYPSKKKIVSFKLAAAGIHLLASMGLREGVNDEAANAFQVMSIGVQGLVVGWNMQFM